MNIHRFKVDKLIRDKVPEILRSKNIALSTHQMSDKEFLMRLKNKLIEEAHEVSEAKNAKDLLEELADVSEVFRTLAHLSGFSLDDIEKARQEKRLKNGGFERRVYTEFIEISADNEAIEYYRTRPDQYPEIKK